MANDTPKPRATQAGILSFWQRLSFAFMVVILASIGHPAQAIEEFRPALLYESETENGDNAFIDSMQKGAMKARDELGVTYEEFRFPAGQDRVEYVRTISQSGVTHIIAVGFQNVVPILTVAEEFPEVKFTVIDGIVPPLFSNVQSINFKDHEGAFLVGMVAGYLSPSNRVGFIGGMDVPVINNIAIGFYQGARHANKNIELVRNTVGTDASAWNNPEKAQILAKKQFNSGIDIIFAAAGGSSVGVLQAASETGKFAIGVDTNQNGLYPGTVITSMVKRVDKAVYDTLVNSFGGQWEPGIKYLGVRENALDYAVDVNNRKNITKEIIEKVENAKDQIVRGIITVESYKPY